MLGETVTPLASTHIIADAGHDAARGVGRVALTRMTPTKMRSKWDDMAIFTKR